MEGADLKPLQHQTLPVLAGIVLSFIFGLSFLFSKEALATLEPLELLAHRFSLAVAILFLLRTFRLTNFNYRPGMLRDLLPLALFQPVVYFLGETYGVKLTTASESGLVISLVPLAVTFLGNLWLHENATWRQWIFIWISLIGVGSIIVSHSGVNIGQHSVGIIYLLVAVSAAAIYNVMSRKLSGKYNPLEITSVMMGTGAIFFNSIYYLSLPEKAAYFSAFTNYKTILSLVYLGGLSSVVAFFLVNYMLKQLPASRAAAFTNLTTIVSVLAGILFRGERFGLIQLFGGVMILIGVWGSNLFQPRITDRQAKG